MQEPWHAADGSAEKGADCDGERREEEMNGGRVSDARSWPYASCGRASLLGQTFVLMCTAAFSALACAGALALQPVTPPLPACSCLCPRIGVCVRVLLVGLHASLDSLRCKRSGWAPPARVGYARVLPVPYERGPLAASWNESARRTGR